MHFTVGQLKVKWLQLGTFFPLWPRVNRGVQIEIKQAWFLASTLAVLIVYAYDGVFYAVFYPVD